MRTHAAYVAKAHSKSLPLSDTPSRGAASMLLPELLRELLRELLPELLPTPVVSCLPLSLTIHASARALPSLAVPLLLPLLPL